MQSADPLDKPAPLRNVANFTMLLEKVVNRRSCLPGMATFYGVSGLGKSRSATFAAGRSRATYVECGQFTTAKSLLEALLKELGVAKPRGTVPRLIEDAIYLLAADPRRPVIVDEAHHIAHKRFVDLLRELHDKSGAPVILIGEETLPKQLETHERVHNRMLDWVQALPLDRDDLNTFAGWLFPELRMSDELAERILRETHGNTRRAMVNLDKAAEAMRRTGAKEATSILVRDLIRSSAPAPRRAS
ncbi:ATP-binding protein [Methylopila sp. M107]|uniref:AAA family ATPase n=1 Tax=Methylopila sp. M107 TaxID=1101190 RepID=UPI0003616EFB|nr:ATP-binding protein [Methylopila sp. M107]